jgi:predicted nucleic acid-binding protein
MLGEIQIGLSVVTIAELIHGAYRAKTQEQEERRLAFIERLCSDVPVHPVTLDISRLAGRIEGQQEAKGIKLAFEDLLIGATALHLGYTVATLNIRDFQRIPGRSCRSSIEQREKIHMPRYQSPRDRHS